MNEWRCSRKLKFADIFAKDFFLLLFLSLFIPSVNIASEESLRVRTFNSHEIAELCSQFFGPWEKGKYVETKKAFPEDEIYRAFAER